MPLFRLGFRPFYSLASVFAVAALAAWLLFLRGDGGLNSFLPGVAWHSHEMVFGFACAVLAGFLLTAVRNWTGLPTPTGSALAGLALVWGLARVLITFGPYTAGAVLDMVFLPALALAVGVPIFRSRNQRNYKVLALVLLLAALNIGFHLSVLGLAAPWVSRMATLAAIDVFVVLMSLVGGRVIFAFTRNAIPDADPRFEGWVEWVAFGTLIAALLTTMTYGRVAVPPAVATVLFVVGAAAQMLRLYLWEPYRTIGNSLLWMLPAAYSWIPFALLLRALSVQGVIAPSAWLHAITMGAVAGLMIAMMIRSTLGHTGRPLAATHSDMAIFVLAQLAAVVRVAGAISGGEPGAASIQASGVLWMLAFGVFAYRFLPMLASARADGKPG